MRIQTTLVACAVMLTLACHWTSTNSQAATGSDRRATSYGRQRATYSPVTMMPLITWRGRRHLQGVTFSDTWYGVGQRSTTFAGTYTPQAGLRATLDRVVGPPIPDNGGGGAGGGDGGAGSAGGDDGGGGGGGASGDG
ncbi:hypothetical protein Vafri_146 [Volvox africanus]|nr:hypothetical protein Vafri_146 [Volvox africanus]